LRSGTADRGASSYRWATAVCHSCSADVEIAYDVILAMMKIRKHVNAQQ